MKKVVVYDIETLQGCYTYTDIDIDTKVISKFVIHPKYNDYKKFLLHLSTIHGMIGFNNLNFDYPVLHNMLINKSLYLQLDGAGLVKMIYETAQATIQKSRDNEFPSIKEKEVLIPQMDLYKIWHFDNKAKATSLKALQCSMNWHNVLEMPIDHTRVDISDEEIKDILHYNENDVLSTFHFLKLTKDLGKIELRKKLREKFRIPCTNWNNGKIGEQLILKFYCELTGENPYDVKQLRTPRNSISLLECIPEIVDFKYQVFKDLCATFEKTKIYDTKGELEFAVTHKEHNFTYGTGGLHGMYKPGIYTSTETKIIKSLDVSGMYGNIPLVLGYYPEHLGEEFLKVYKEKIVDVRMLEKAKPAGQRDKTIIDGYKEATNIPYGKSNYENSFLYDPLFTMKVTITGQLYLTMLCEALQDIPDSILLISNTDGCEILIDRKHEELYHKICKEWEAKTKLSLEFKDYQKMWIRDVNSYGSLDMEGKIKNKGAFEIEKKIGDEPAYHKNNSFKIIPIALQEYFLNGTPVKDTVKGHKFIYDFCGRYKFVGSDRGELVTPEGNKKTQKVLRYYISNTNSKLFKVAPNRKVKLTAIQKGFSITEFNKYEEKAIEDYKINYDFYIEKAKEIILILESKHTTPGKQTYNSRKANKIIIIVYLCLSLFLL